MDSVTDYTREEIEALLDQLDPNSALTRRLATQLLATMDATATLACLGECFGPRDTPDTWAEMVAALRAERDAAVVRAEAAEQENERLRADHVHEEWCAIYRNGTSGCDCSQDRSEVFHALGTIATAEHDAAEEGCSVPPRGPGMMVLDGIDWSEPPCFHGEQCSGLGSDCGPDEGWCWPRLGKHVEPHTCAQGDPKEASDG